MNTQEHLFTIVMEECCEVAQRVSKAKRFGIEEIQPEQTLTNAQRVMQEFADLVGAIEMLQERGLLPLVDPHAVEAKKMKVAKFLEYSRQQGTLTE